MTSSSPRRNGSSAVQPLRRTPTIVVVDGRPSDYRDWESTAASANARLLLAANTAEALRIARTTAVDLWVVNVELPGLSGYELCRMLKAQSPGTTVYLVADEGSATAEQQAWQARATMFSFKPAHHAWLELWLEQQNVRRRFWKPPAMTSSTLPLAQARAS